MIFSSRGSMCSLCRPLFYLFSHSIFTIFSSSSRDPLADGMLARDTTNFTVAGFGLTRHNNFQLAHIRLYSRRILVSYCVTPRRLFFLFCFYVASKYIRFFVSLTRTRILNPFAFLPQVHRRRFLLEFHDDTHTVQNLSTREACYIRFH